MAFNGHLRAYASSFLAFAFSSQISFAQASTLKVPAITDSPPALEGAVIYGVVPSHFGSSPLQGVTSKLDYLKNQGVDVLWIAPVNKTDDPSQISYSITDYFEIREDFGSKADLKQLTSEAHRRGMKVILDFVPNHTGREHPWQLDQEKKGKASDYYDFFARNEDGEISQYFDWKHLFNLNLDHPKVERHIIDAFKYWVTECGVDGYRIDVAWGIRQRSPDFWMKARRELESVKPDIIMLAEAPAQDPYYANNGFDLAYDWDGDVPVLAWGKSFEEPSQAGSRLHSVFLKSKTSPHRIARFMNNNDTADRFITRYGIGMTRVAAALMHTIPGVPVVYSGDEIGAEYQPYDDNPPLKWEEPHKLQAYYQKLAKLRETVPALAKGEWTALEPKKNAGTYSYFRAFGPEKPVLVVLNFNRGTTEVEVAIPESYRNAFNDQPLVNLLDEQSVATQSSKNVLKLSIKGRTALILTPQN